MRQALVYGDSLSWGMVPNTRERLPFHLRWSGVAESDPEEEGVEETPGGGDAQVGGCVGGQTAVVCRSEFCRNGAMDLVQLLLALAARGKSPFDRTCDSVSIPFRRGSRMPRRRVRVCR